MIKYLTTVIILEIRSNHELCFINVIQFELKMIVYQFKAELHA